MLWVTLPWLPVVANSAENSDLTKVSEQDPKIFCVQKNTHAYLHMHTYTHIYVHKYAHTNPAVPRSHNI